MLPIQHRCVTVRAMAKPKASKAGRPANPNKPPLPPMTGLRLPDDLRAELDAIVEQENARLAPEGASTNRTAVMVRMLRESVARWNAGYTSKGGPQS